MSSPAEQLPQIPQEEFWVNSLTFEYLPNAKLNGTERDILDILFSRQEYGGLVEVTQKELAKRLGVQQPNISRALAGLAQRGIIDPPEIRRRGQIRIHPLFARYPSARHAAAVLQDPELVTWRLDIPTPEMRPPRLEVASRPAERPVRGQRPALRVVRG
ncbi:helix-turn-helix transcriptional regulator [Streptomyces sp. NRRL S-350]|uniref:helix-turn-helix transcriptional regulator n=1 Tax=Streptomyces sp. NRRL S-350 TaxID=1463902 RepID=UPI00131E107F|nr:helix-turn-helix domain-containing protein [Streptomyces sp. NRRL S-350]